MGDAAAVVGCGSMGQRHIRNLKALGVETVLAVDPAAQRLVEARESGAIPQPDLAAALDELPRAVLVCTPPTAHLEPMRAALERGAHVFVEKPLAASLDGVDEVLATADARRLVVCVGYNLRFHAGLLKAKALLDAGEIGRLLVAHAEFGQYLPDWRPGDYRESYSARRALGGGIVLEASHEIDYVRWLAGEVVAVSAVAERLGALEIDVEDIALVTLRLATGALAHLHLDALQRSYTRGCKLIGTEGTLVWDFASGVRHYSARSGEWKSFPIVPEKDEMYREELRHFLASVGGAARPLPTGGDGKRALEVALATRRAALERREVEV